MCAKSYTLKRGCFDSSDGINKVAYYIFEPKEKPSAIIQISHGMCEYIERYEEFADFICDEGIVVCGNDHLGHGNTAKCDEDLGFIAERGGYRFVLDDLQKMTELAKGEYPDIPLILLGHSMGSFFARLYMSELPDSADAVIISGTAGPESPTGAGKLLARINTFFFGGRNRSKFIYKIAFGNYSKKYPKDSPEHLWISRDGEILQKYANDKFCTFRFTASAYHDLFTVLGKVSKKRWAKTLRHDMPILMISGDMDPVGNWGRGVVKVYERIKGAGVQDITLKLYRDGHHEMLNETNRYDVFYDILAWLKYHGFVKETD